MTITSKVAVVTGAGRGIGRAVAARLSKDGFHVVAADLDAQGAHDCAERVPDSGGQAEALALDVTDRTAVRAAFADIHQRLGRIDALVNNAMWIKYAPLVDFDEDAVDAMFGIGVKSSIWTMQAAIPVMKAQGGGAIVNLSSPAAIRSVPGGALYSAVKGAVTSLTLQSAGELGRDGIRVNAVMPGSVPTEGARAVVDDSGFELRKTRTPVGRLGRPEDIAAAIAFIVSPDADFVTGHVLAADGGFSVT